jgi:hypothetical protein
MTPEIIIPFVEDYIYERKKVRVKIRYPQGMVELIQLTEAYQYARNYMDNKPKES